MSTQQLLMPHMVAFADPQLFSPSVLSCRWISLYGGGAMYIGGSQPLLMRVAAGLSVYGLVCKDSIDQQAIYSAAQWA